MTLARSQLRREHTREAIRQARLRWFRNLTPEEKLVEAMASLDKLVKTNAATRATKSSNVPTRP